MTKEKRELLKMKDKEFTLLAVPRKSMLRFLASNPSKDLVIRPVEEADWLHVLDHVTPIFLRDEPLSHCFSPCTTGKRAEDFRGYAQEQLRSGFSVLALDGSTVVGSCLCRQLSRDQLFSYEIPEELQPGEDPLNYHVVRMIVALHRELDLFSALNVDRILDIGLVSVEASHSGRGLATRMMCSSLELAALQGLRASKADCTGPASAAACRRVGMHEVHRLHYDEYKLQDQVVFQNTPHRGTHLTVMAARLQSSSPHVLLPSSM